MKEITFNEMIIKYNECYNCNVKKFRYKDEEELEEIIQEVFDTDDNIEVDYDKEVVIIG